MVKSKSIKTRGKAVKKESDFWLSDHRRRHVDSSGVDRAGSIDVHLNLMGHLHGIIFKKIQNKNGYATSFVKGRGRSSGN